MTSKPIDYCFDDDKIIVITANNLVSVDAKSGEIVELFTADFWWYLRVNSIIKKGDSYYIGADMGILEYKIESGDICWYQYYDYEIE